MKLTRKMIDDGKSDNGAWSAKQLAILGVPWPPLRGWPERIIGTEISESDYQTFLDIRKRKKPLVETGGMFHGDANVESVRAKMKQRAEVGFRKYGVTTEREDIDLLGWLNHLQQELMDAAIYAEKLIKKEEVRRAFEFVCSGSNECGQVGIKQSPESFANALFEQTAGKLD